MVNSVIGPTVRSELAAEAGSSVISPLQPNQMPPFCFRASSTPAARPPDVGSPSVIGATRLETTTRRDILLDLDPKPAIPAERHAAFPAARFTRDCATCC